MRRTDREVTDIENLTEILNGCKTACIAMMDGNMPYVLPMSYGYEFVEDKLILYFHCAKEGRKLDILKENNNVCFTVFSEGEPVHADTPCNSGYYYASIVGKGRAELIESPAEKCDALTRMFEHQTGKTVEFTDAEAATVCVFKIVSREYTGKRNENN